MRLSVLAIALAVSAPGFAQEPRPPLTLASALDEALAHNPELVALRRAHDAARHAPEAERALMPPMFETQIWQWPVTTLNPARTDSYMFMAEQALPGRGKRDLRVAVGEREADMARRAIAVRAVEILNGVKQAYADVRLARETLDIYERQVAVLRSMADAATSRYSAGRIGQQDTLKAVVELARLSEEQISWRERERMAEASLNALLARSVEAPIESLGRAPQVAAVPASADLQRVALERHPEIAMARAAIAREEADLARIRGDRKPDFIVGGGYMLMPGEAGAWTARAGITWPNAPWSRGRLNAEIATQEKRLDTARAQLTTVETNVRLMVQSAVIRLEAARNRAELLRTSVLPHAEHTFEVTRVGYQADRAAFLDLIDNQRTLLTARIDYVRALVDVERAAAELERATGGYDEATRSARAVEEK
jgi:outer membrane protein TolC